MYEHFEGFLSLFFPFSTQTHILELIEELGLETYQQYNAGKKVHHMGGLSAKIRTYSTSIPALSPLVLMDLTQFLWRVRQQTDTKIFCTQSYVQVEQLKKQLNIRDAYIEFCICLKN